MDPALSPAENVQSTNTTNTSATVRTNLTWDLPSTSNSKPDILGEERDKHRRRAERFGATFIEPGRNRSDMAVHAKKERLKREGFVTGFDPFSKEEEAKKRDRAARFQIPDAPVAKYKPDDDVAAKARRAQKFGVEYEPSSAVLMDMDLFEDRKEVSRDTVRRMDAIYLYGVDVMSTNDCLKYFQDYGPTFVEWINDSSCNVLFSDFASAKRAMVGSGRPLPPVQGSAAEGLDPTDLDSLPYLWHQGQDFVKEGTPVHLVYRVATVEDVKVLGAPKTTRELWKLGSKTRGRPRRNGHEEEAGKSTSQRRHGDDVDEDGDIEMRPMKKPRGGRRERRRQQQRAGGANPGSGDDDIDMNDADEAGKRDSTRDLRTEIHSSVATTTVDMGPPAFLISASEGPAAQP